MQDKMMRFLSSLGISDPSSFDMDFTRVKNDKEHGGVIIMDIKKDTPWEYALLEEFQEALVPIKYPYALSFSYSSAPTLEDVDSLFQDWYLSLYHGVSDILFSKGDNASSIVYSYPENESTSQNEENVIKDFIGLIKALSYPFTLTKKGEASEKPLPMDEDVKESEVCEEDGEEEKTDVASNEEASAMENNDDSLPSKEEVEEEDKHSEELAKAEQEYLSDLKKEHFTLKGNYYKVESLDEIYSLPLENVEVEGTIYEATAKLSRRHALMGTYGLGDDKSAISVKAFESHNPRFPSSLTPEDISGVEVGNVVRIKGQIDIDKFSGEKYVKADFIEHLPPKPLRSDPEINKRVELHLHTKMSAMDGVGEMSDYCKLAKNMGMSAIAVTDHGDIQSFPAAQNAAKKNGLHMIYGCEFYMFDPHPKYIFNPSPILLSKATYCVFDLETTGLSAVYDRITEFGGVIVEHGMVTRRFDQLINPGCHIPDKITAKTHIDDNMVKDKPHIEECIDAIVAFIGQAILVSHNAAFDYGFLNESLSRAKKPLLTNPVVDTLAMSHFLFPEKRYHSLGNLSNNLGLSTYNDEEAHRADFDAEALWNVWAAILPRINKKGTLTHADLENLSFDEDYFPGLTGEALANKIKETTASFYKNIRPTHMIALVKNAEGLKDMYKLISLSNTEYLADVPKIPKSELNKYRANLLFGSACFNSDVFDTAIYRSFDELKKVMSFYDYIELQPLENYSYLINIGDLDKPRLMEILNSIVKAADELGKPLVATGDVHYVNPSDKIARDVYIDAKAIGGSRHPLNPNRREKMPHFENPDQHFRSTKEMLDSFREWLPENRCQEIVITNTQNIAKQIEDVYPVKPDIFPPNANLPDSAERLKEICYGNLHKVYGDNPDPLIKQRLDRELDGIIGHGYSVTYYIAHCIIKKANEDGYFVGSRGSVGSSFAATMADITEVNPLAPHYLCPKCKHFEWNKDPKIKSGFDLPDKKCPECGTLMVKNGQNIPFETFLGFKADKVPDIDLNFPPDYQARAHDYTRTLLGAKNCFRAGTIETVAEKIAFGFVRGYYERQGIDPSKVPTAQIAKVANMCQGVKRTTGQHPGGIVVIPKDMDVFDFTPYQHPADDLNSDWLTTHYEFASMHDEVLKLDLLGHVDPLALRKLQLITHVDFRTIPMDDRKVLSLFSSPKALGMKSNPLKFQTGAVALPEFGTTFVQGLLSEAHPHSFNDLLIISGLSHGTDVWNNNAEDLVNNKTASLDEVIGCRDDIMNYLISMGVEHATAFSIMEEVRHNKVGKPLKPATIKAMEDAKVPGWYIDSCKKIRYLFPRAHATAYVMGAFRMAWFKLYRPLYFYAVYFTVRCNKWDIITMQQGEDAILMKISELQTKSQDKKAFTDKDNEILKTLIASSEMEERGFHFQKINLYKSEAEDFVVDEATNSLIPPFGILDGLGINAAESVVKARKDGEFISKEDLSDRTNLSETNIKDLSEEGALDGLGDTNQMTLF
jgi:DNA polymerase-3 subunit alpha (Gram-positive type)